MKNIELSPQQYSEVDYMSDASLLSFTVTRRKNNNNSILSVKNK